MFYIMMVFIIMTPTLLFLMGLRFLKTPKQTNKLAFHLDNNQETHLWRYTHKLASYVFIRLGLLMFEGSLLIFLKLLKPNRSDYVLIPVSLGIIMAELGIVFLAILLIESFVKKEAKRWQQ